ncbi:MAG: sulfatase-like hydrolase/transferase, partial [Proteobacteria bacterium]|nr:sulfatase-like hydrolase/transferase [Pseudomonadota bacterium]
MRHSNSTLLLTLLLLLPGFASNLMAQASQRPNFIVVMADDLGYGDLGIYGSTLIDTPNIDLMALQGIRLNSFYSSANVCTAARGGLLTGRYPIRLDLVSDVARPSNEIHLAEDEITLAEALRFIEDNRDNPFFLYLPHSFPHVPLFVSDQFSGRSDAGLYGDVVETIDWSMGMIL